MHIRIPSAIFREAIARENLELKQQINIYDYSRQVLTIAKLEENFNFFINQNTAIDCRLSSCDLLYAHIQVIAKFLPACPANFKLDLSANNLTHESLNLLIPTLRHCKRGISLTLKQTI